MSKGDKQAKVREIVGLLCAQFPDAFSGTEQPRPLKIGIHADVVAALGGKVKSREVRSALAVFASRPGYLRSLTAGTQRFGIDGQPPGTVTPEEAAHAQARLGANRARPAEIPAGNESLRSSMTQAAENDKAPGEPAAKRLSLADLREAGRQQNPPLSGR